MYKIKYCYNTGDSFHTERDRVEHLELTWADIEVAKDNLRRIKEHYEYYLVRNGYKWRIKMTKKEKENHIEQAKKKDWFVKEYELSLMLVTDSGNPCQISAPWCGYFESLNDAEIVEDHSDRKISFR